MPKTGGNTLEQTMLTQAQLLFMICSVSSDENAAVKPRGLGVKVPSDH